jgi:hypothetical protein
VAQSIADVLEQIEKDNVKIRERFVSRFDVLDFSLKPQPDWMERLRAAVAEGRAISVIHRGRNLFPLFQLQDRDDWQTSELWPAIAEILSILKGRSSWQIAFWLVSSNGWLGGETPLANLTLPGQHRLIEAAVREIEPIMG